MQKLYFCILSVNKWTLKNRMPFIIIQKRFKGKSDKASIRLVC